jgi:hypothetical protein
MGVPAWQEWPGEEYVLGHGSLCMGQWGLPVGRPPRAQEAQRGRHWRTRAGAGCPALAGRAPPRACSSALVLIRLRHLPRRGILPCNAWAACSSSLLLFCISFAARRRVRQPYS